MTERIRTTSDRRLCTRRWMGLAISLVLAVWAWEPQAQELSVLMQSIDNIEKRLNKMEADLQKIKKAGPAGKEKKDLRGPSDSSTARLPFPPDSLKSKLDLLAIKVARLDTAMDSQARDGAANVLGKELGALGQEVKSLTAALKASRGSLETPSGKSSTGPGTAPVKNPGEASVILPKPDLALSGNVQIHGERKFTTAHARDNLDFFWGRVNIGLDYKDDRLQSKINIRIFPDGFGFDPLTGVTFDTSGQGSVKTQTDPQAKVQINNAWVKFSWPDLDARVGRIEMHDGPSESFGYYLDGAPSGKFMSRKPGSGHNALEFTSQRAGFSTSMVLAAADKKVNRGYLRLQEKYAGPMGFQAGVGYRSNVFDQWKYPEAEILHRFDMTLGYEIRKGVHIFGEGALIQVPNRLEDDLPFLIGLQFPVAPFVDQVSLEAEFLSTRQVKSETRLEDKSWLFNAYGRRKFYKRVNFEMGLFSDATRVDAAALGMGLRMTSSIK